MKSGINIEWFDSKLSPAEKSVINILFRNNYSFPTKNNRDENELLKFVEQNGVSSLLYKTITDKKTDIFSDTLTGQLKKDYLKTLLVNTNLTNTAKKINTLFNENGIPVVFLKGILLASFLYEDVSLRPMSDIDLLVPEEFIDKAFELMKAKGAVEAYPTDKDHPSHHHLPMLMYKNAPLEIHRFLFPELSTYFIPPDDIFKNKTIWSNGSFSLPGPSYIHTFIYMSVHVYYTFMRGGMRLSWMADFISMISKGKVIPVTGNEEFSYWVKKWNANYPVEFILTLSKLLTGEKNIEYDKKHQQKLAQDISLATGFFKASAHDATSYSYRLIWEQIKNAKGLRSKYGIIKTKVFRRAEQEGVLPRIAHLTSRTAGMFLNSIKLAFKRTFGKY